MEYQIGFRFQNGVDGALERTLDIDRALIALRFGI